MTAPYLETNIDLTDLVNSSRCRFLTRLITLSDENPKETLIQVYFKYALLRIDV